MTIEIEKVTFAPNVFIVDRRQHARRIDRVPRPVQTDKMPR